MTPDKKLFKTRLYVSNKTKLQLKDWSKICKKQYKKAKA
jgi:hypothetical protein